jgi:adenine-specific DNA-methyltransferase
MATPDELYAVEGETPDFREELLSRLRDAAPEAFTDGKLDLERLAELAGEGLETSPERYGLTWPGKRDAIAMLQAPSRATLVPDLSESVSFDKAQHVFIEGENLEVLKLLYRSYFGRVKLIYIDPPYNTGKDFIYPDDFSDPLGSYLRLTGQVNEQGDMLTSKPEVQGRKHSAWLSMMYPRLSLARQFLTEDGAIFVSIDGNEIHNLIDLMDEIFGEENRVDVITVINNLKGRNDRENVSTCHEYLVIYTRKDFSSRGLPLTEEQKALYKETDKNGDKYALRDLRKRGRPDRREDRPNMFFPIFYDTETRACSLERNASTDVKIEPKRGDGSDGRWRWGKQRVERNLHLLHAKYSKKKNRWDLAHRVYLNPALGPLNGDGEEEDDDDDVIYERTSKSKSFWTGGEISTDVARREFKKLFPEFTTDEYTKSPFFLQRIIQMAPARSLRPPR